MTEAATLFEVGPRDGLQNEAAFVATEDKVRLVDMLTAAGLREIEVTSFVSPKWVPQMADAAEVMAAIQPGPCFSVLTPNLRGFEGALAAGADKVAVFGAASESFSQKNINCSIDESFARFQPVMEAARGVVPVRGYVSCVTDCPFEGEIAPEAVARVAGRLRAMGCAEISLGETLGRGHPERVAAMLEAVLEEVPAAMLAGHFHDTGGRALENIRVSLAAGLRVFDAAVGGLGGCPYAPGAPGNVASEAVLALLEAEGFETGVDAGALAAAGEFAKALR